MDSEGSISLIKEALQVLLAVSMPLLLVGLVVGVVVSLVQAATQVQEASLQFVPKLLAMGATFWFTAPWCGEKLVDYCHEIFAHIADVGGGGAF
jgi:flagellar biosynthetic protein FliQ